MAPHSLVLEVDHKVNGALITIQLDLIFELSEGDTAFVGPLWQGFQCHFLIPLDSAEALNGGVSPQRGGRFI